MRLHATSVELQPRLSFSLVILNNRLSLALVINTEKNYFKIRGKEMVKQLYFFMFSFSQQIV